MEKPFYERLEGHLMFWRGLNCHNASDLQRRNDHKLQNLTSSLGCQL